jgi:hypothetical protein
MPNQQGAFEPADKFFKLDEDARVIPAEVADAVLTAVRDD